MIKLFLSDSQVLPSDKQQAFSSLTSIKRQAFMQDLFSTKMLNQTQLQLLTIMPELRHELCFNFDGLNTMIHSFIQNVINGDPSLTEMIFKLLLSVDLETWRTLSKETLKNFLIACQPAHMKHIGPYIQVKDLQDCMLYMPHLNEAQKDIFFDMWVKNHFDIWCIPMDKPDFSSLFNTFINLLTQTQLTSIRPLLDKYMQGKTLKDFAILLQPLNTEKKNYFLTRYQAQLQQLMGPTAHAKHVGEFSSVLEQQHITQLKDKSYPCLERLDVATEVLLNLRKVSLDSNHLYFETIVLSLIDEVFTQASLVSLPCFINALDASQLKRISTKIALRLTSISELTSICSNLMYLIRTPFLREVVLCANPILFTTASIQEITLYFKHIGCSEDQYSIIQLMLGNIKTVFELTSLLQSLPQSYHSVVYLQMKEKLTIMLTTEPREHLIANIASITKYLSKDQYQALLKDFKEQIQAHTQTCSPAEIARDIQLFQTISVEQATNYKFILDPQTKTDLQASADIAHSLGLKGGTQEGMNPLVAYQKIKRDFASAYRKAYSLPPDAEIPSLSYDEYSDAGLSLKLAQVWEHGDLQGIKACWQRHSISFFVLRDAHELHLIYVNKGQQHHETTRSNQTTTPTVMVFTFEAHIADRHIRRLHQVIQTCDRDTISDFIFTLRQRYYNESASQILVKKQQKVGNCTIANSKIAWHMVLAAQQMKQHPELRFVQAYVQTKPVYKRMCMEDRATQFCKLVIEDIKDFTPSTVEQSALEQTCEKMYFKDVAEPTRQTILFLLTRLKSQDPSALVQLFNQLTLSLPADQARLAIKLAWATPIVALSEESTDNAFHQCLQTQITPEKKVVGQLVTRPVKANAATQAAEEMTQPEPHKPVERWDSIFDDLSTTQLTSTHATPELGNYFKA